MTQSTLPINRLVNVTVNLAPNAAQIQNISTLLILGTSSIIDITERFRIYTSIAAVASDFGTTAEEYLAALLWFEQSPQPTYLQIGRWANTNTKAVLRGGALPTAQQAISNWTSISAGSFSVTIDGTVTAITGLNFSAQTNLNGIASVIQTALQVTKPASTCIWNANFSRFEITSGTSGASSTLTFLTAQGTGTDISSTLAMRSTSSGAYISQGMVAETALAAVSLFDAQYGQGWYGVTIPDAADSDHLAVAAYIQSATTKHTYWITTNEAGVLSSVSTTDIAYQISQLGYNRTALQFSSSNAYAACSLAAKALTIDYTGNNTVIDLMYKQEPGITAESMALTQLNSLEGKNCNVFLAYNNNTAIIEQGNMSDGTPIDIITGTDWLALSIQTAVYNLLYLNPTKVPQTDQGNHMIVTTIESVLSQAVRDGLLAPGVWSSGGFGALNSGDFLPKGFYVYAPPIALQNIADRSARKSVLFQVAAKLAGAIRTVNVLINVNR